MKIMLSVFLKPSLLLLVWAMPLFGAFAQANKLYGTVNGTEIRPDSLPLYPGGEAEMLQFIARNMRYPESAIEEGLQGKLLVSLIVNEAGNVTDVKVEKGVSPDLDREAQRVVKLLQTWKPAYANGQPVRYRKIVPIMFKLQ